MTDLKAGGTSSFDNDYVNFERHKKFIELSKEIQERYYHDPIVHIMVSAYLYDKIGYLELLNGLISSLIIKNIEKLYNSYVDWFGCPKMEKKL